MSSLGIELNIGFAPIVFASTGTERICSAAQGGQLFGWGVVRRSPSVADWGGPPLAPTRPPRSKWVSAMAPVVNLIDQLRRASLLFVVALGPLLVVRIVPGTPLGAIDVLAPVTLTLLMLSRRSWGGFRGIFLLYVCWLVASAFLGTLFFSESSFGAVVVKVVRLVGITSPLFLAGAVRSNVWRTEELVLRIAVVTTTAGVVVGLVLHYLGITFEDTQRLFLEGGGVARAAGLTGNTGSFGFLIAVALVLSQFCRDDLLPVSARIWRPLNAAVCLVAVVASSSRGALIAVAAAVLVVAIRQPKRLAAAAVVGVSIVPLIQTVAGRSEFVMASLVRIDVFNQTGQSSFTDSGRAKYWQRSVELILDDPWIGRGFKQFHEVEGYYLDNAYLLALAESGVIGCCLLVTFIFLVGRSAYQLEVSSRLVNEPLAAMLIAALAARMLTGGANSDWYVTPLIFAVVGLRIRSEEHARHLDEALSDTGSDQGDHDVEQDVASVGTGATTTKPPCDLKEIACD